jgi:hypothetical protein
MPLPVTRRTSEALVKPMAQLLDPKEVVSIEELTISNMYEIEALIEVLAEKGLIHKEELEEINTKPLLGGELATGDICPIQTPYPPKGECNNFVTVKTENNPT